MDIAELHRRTVESWRSRLEAVAVDDWSRPTPCSEWDVRALVNHVTGEELWTVPLVERSTMEEVGHRFDGDVLGEDPVTVGLDAAATAVSAVDAQLPLGGVVHLSFGETPIEEYVRQLSADHLIHSWDLAAATQQDTALDPELVGEVAAWYADREEMYRAAGVVGPASLAAGDDAQSQLLAAFGRSPARAEDGG